MFIDTHAHLTYLNTLEKFGMHLGLERIRYLLEKLNNPQLKFKSLHIAGTNGKGSTAAMIASILKEAGYKVGLYTSPHLFDYRERITINGKDISTKQFTEGIKRVRKAQEGLGQPTVFEVLTATAFWYFAKEKVDYAVIEVGLGGRLDATNVIIPLVSVITNIDYEHTEVLGKTLAKIAQEKAAIIKSGVPVVTAENKKDPLKIIKKTCQKNNCFLIAVSRKQLAVNSNLLGQHQKVNAACAIAAIRFAGIAVSHPAIKKGLKKVYWPGRFQVFSLNRQPATGNRQQLIILDGAHNPAGTKVLRKTLEELYPQEKFILIFGCQKDKDYPKMLRILKPLISQIILVRSSHSSSLNPSVMAKFLTQENIPYTIANSLAASLKATPGKEKILVTGSLYLVADALKILS